MIKVVYKKKERSFVNEDLAKGFIDSMFLSRKQKWTINEKKLVDTSDQSTPDQLRTESEVTHGSEGGLEVKPTNKRNIKKSRVQE